MHPVVKEAIETLESYDLESTTENIEEEIISWIQNLASTLGKRSQERMRKNGVSFSENFSKKEYDKRAREQIKKYIECLDGLCQ